MKKKEFTILNILLGCLVLFFAVMTVNLSANQNPFSYFKDSFHNKQAKTDVVLAASTVKQQCSKKQPVQLSAAGDPQLKKLDEYQNMCGSFVTDKMMFFTSFPENPKDAQTAAAVMSQRLKKFQDAGINPLVIVEPYVGNHPMSYRTYLNGAYDAALESYFINLKNAGITDQMMGTWVPFPESNTPNWENKDTEPRDFALCVNKYLGKLKKHFPSAKGSILLNSTTYSPSDIEWENGDYLNLTPYIQDIDHNLVDSFGMQGFPWVTNAKVKRREIFRPSEFLQTELAISAAQELRTRDIWFNTGSFYAKYTNDPSKTAYISTNDRKAILSGILDEVKKVQNYQQNEYRVSINIFSENKSTANEATDWSYHQNDDSKALLVDFLHNSEEQNIPISIFDQ